MDHPHPFGKVTRHPRLFLGYTTQGKYLRHARGLRLFARKDWDEFIWWWGEQGWHSAYGKKPDS